jgi:ketosteroid isomerase-like protein
MKSMTSRMAVASALAAVSLSAVAAVEGPRGTQTVERHDGTTAQVRGVGEVLASWTGSIPVGLRTEAGGVAAHGGRGARLDHAHGATQVLASWTGTIPVEAGARIIADGGGHDRVWREPKRGGQGARQLERLELIPPRPPSRAMNLVALRIPSTGLLLAALAVPALQARAADSAARQPAQASQIEVMRRRVAATNSKDFAAWETLHAPGACRTTPDLQGSLCGRAAMRAALEALSAAFPDYALELVEASGDGDRLAVRMHASGTHTGTLILSDGTAVPPTGRHFEQDWVAVVTFDPQGRIEHIDEFYDESVLLLQLGLAQPL